MGARATGFRRAATAVAGFVAVWAAKAAELRFPPPEFESGHQLPQITAPPPRAEWLQFLDIAVLAAALALACWMGLRRRSRKGLLALAAFSLLYFGFYRKGCICAIGAPQNVILALFDPSYSVPLSALAFFVLPLAVALFAGRAFCGAVCPHGALQELVLIRPVRLPSWLTRALGLIPYAFLGAGLVLAAAGGGFLFCRWDPFVPLFRMAGSALMVAVGLGTLVLSMFVGRPFCRFLCPYGALLRLASAAARWRVRVTPSRCTECRLCDEACPYDAIRPPARWSRDPRRLAEDRGRLARAILGLPALVLVGAWLGGFAAPPLALLNGEVRFANRYLAGERAAQFADPQSPEALALARIEADPEKSLRAAAAVRRKAAIGGRFLGGWLGLIVGGWLIGLSVRPRREEFEPERGACFVCGRCYAYCPEERTRLGLPPWETEEEPDREAAAEGAARPVGSGAQPDPKPGPRAAARALLRTARIAGAFSALLGALMLVDHWRAQKADPFHSQEMAALRKQLHANPKDEALKEKIRRLDLELRRRYFAHLRSLESGKWFLAVGVLLVALSGRQARKLIEPPPMPSPETDPETAQRAELEQARRAVILGGTAVAGFFLALRLGSQIHVPPDEAALQALLRPEETPAPAGAKLPPEASAARAPRPAPAAQPEQPLPPPEVYLANWPRFLGPNGNAWVKDAKLPIRWDAASGSNIAWRVPLPLPGFNSPVRWGDRIFLTGGDTNRLAVFCFDLQTGKQLWAQEVPQGQPLTADQIEALSQSGLAAPTAAIDGLRVYAIFATGDLAAFTLEGKPLWRKSFGLPENDYGHASSLVAFEGKLIVLLDQGAEDEGKGRIYLLNGADGSVIWEKKRQVATSWTTPTVYKAAGKTQIGAVSAPLVVAYNFEDGAELWRADFTMGEAAPSPIFAGGMLIAVSPSDIVAAIRPDGSGDVTETHIVWREEEDVPDIATPVADESRLFTAATYGVLTCVSLKDGKLLWNYELEFDGEINATPLRAGDRIYAFSAEGEVFVGRVSDEKCEPLAKFSMGEPIRASPAVAGDRLIVRTGKALYLIAEGAASSGAASPSKEP